nr:MAG TPA: hypothetical protein [Caudoviricetes sp.]
MASKKARTYKVTGAVAIARLAGGGERYLYQGSVLSGDEYDEAHIQHLLDNRLIEEYSAPADAESSEDVDPEPQKDPAEGEAAGGKKK